MILPANSIRELEIFYPFSDRTVHETGMSYGLSHAGYDIRIKDAVVLEAKGFALGVSLEHITMPDNVMGIVHDKSTWARQGLSVFNTVLEPGWEGYLTLEFANHSHDRLRLRAGQPVAQIVFHIIGGDVIPYTGKYQDQPDVPVKAIFEVS